MRWIITDNGVRLNLSEIWMVCAENDSNDATKVTLVAGIKASQTAIILTHDVSHDIAEKIMDRITDANEDWVLLDLRKDYVEN